MSHSSSEFRPRLAPRVALLAPLLVVGPILGQAAPADAQQEYRIGAEPGWVDLRPSETVPAGSSEDDAQEPDFLLVSLQNRISPSGVESYVQLRYRVRGAGSVQEDSQVEIGFNPAYQDLVLHSVALYREGEWIDQLTPERIQVYDQESQLSRQVVEGWKTAVLFLEDVRVGDVIDYRYTVLGTNPVFQGHFMREFPLRTSGPIDRLHARVLWPKERPFFARVNGAEVEPVVIDAGAYREYVWDLRDTPGMLVEPQVPYWYRAYPTVQISDFASWAEVAEWGRRLFDIAAPVSPELAAVVEEIRASHANVLSRMDAALRFAQDEIRYLGLELGENSHVPYPPAEVLARRYGDCKDKSLLLITMLDALGVEAWPALVSTTYGAHVSGFHPTADVFDHVIVQARLPEGVYWMDPTRLLDREPLEAEVGPYGAALVLEPGTRALTEIPRASMDRPWLDVTARFELGGVEEPSAMEVETVYRGDQATSVRSHYADTPRDQIAQGYVGFYAELYPSIELDGPIEMTDDEASNEVVVTERYLIPEFWRDSEEAGGPVGELHPLEIEYALPGAVSPRRTMPLAVQYPEWIRYQIEARLEDGWQVDPEEVEVETTGARFTYEASVMGDGILRLKYEYKALVDHVTATEAAEHLRGVDRMSELVGYRITPPYDYLTQGVNWPPLILALLLAGACVPLVRWIVRLEGVSWPHHPPETSDEPSGLGGWLLLVALLVVLSPVGALLLVAASLFPLLDPATWTELTTEGSALYHPFLVPTMVMESAAGIALLAASGVMVWAFFKRRSQFPGLFVVIQAVAVGISFLDAAMYQAWAPLWGEVSTTMTDALRSLVGAVIWIPYMFVSRRVRNTFME